MIDYKKPVALTSSGEPVIILSTESPVPDKPVIGYIEGTSEILYFNYEGEGEAGSLENIKDKDFTLYIGRSGEITTEGKHLVEVSVDHEKGRVRVKSRGYLVMTSDDNVQAYSPAVESKPEKPSIPLSSALGEDGDLSMFL